MGEDGGGICEKKAALVMFGTLGCRPDRPGYCASALAKRESLLWGW